MAESARQLGLPGLLRAPEPIRVWTDYGAIGEGASNAHSALCENGVEYLLKGPTFSPDHPYVAANELVSAGLADLLGLPMLDHRVVRLGDDLFFASQLMPKRSWHPFMTSELFDSCVNADQLYGLAVFDPWVCNVDRHAGNLLARTETRSKQTFLVLNDHSHTFVGPGGAIDHLDALADSAAGAYLAQLPWLRERVRNRKQLDQAIKKATDITDAMIQAVVAGVPSALLSAADAQRYVSMIAKRRDRLAEVLFGDPELFPSLGGTA